MVAGVEEAGGRGTRNEEILSTFPTLHATSYPLHYPRSVLTLSLPSFLSLFSSLFFSFFRISSKASPPPIERTENEKERENECGPFPPTRGARRNHPTETIRPTSSSLQPASPPPSANAEAGDYLESFTLPRFSLASYAYSLVSLSLS